MGYFAKAAFSVAASRTPAFLICAVPSQVRQGQR
jgi:hypothetical protein